MSIQPIFDINIYNRYLYYSGGQHPDYYQYQQFVNNLYYQQYYQHYYQQNNPVQNNIEQNNPVQSNNIINKITFCIKGMSCKNINCSDFHHPSKDLDILNESRNK